MVVVVRDVTGRGNSVDDDDVGGPARGAGRGPVWPTLPRPLGLLTTVCCLTRRQGETVALPDSLPSVR